MKQSLQLRLGQQLAMTPQLQQAIRLLQLSTMELQVEVQEALDSNMMLEVAEEDQDFPASSGTASEDETSVTPTDIPAELAVDSAWDDVYDASSAYQSNSDYSAVDFDSQRTETQTLQGHLHWQLDMLRCSDNDRLIGAAVIDAVNDDGYLTISVEDLRQSVEAQGIELDDGEVEAVLHRLQHFDPPGVCARTLSECLALQLNQLPVEMPGREQALQIVTEHLDLLGGRDYPRLMRLLDLSKEELNDLICIIQTLLPRPGELIYTSAPEYIVPDVFVRKIKGVWQVELNPDVFPKLLVNASYAGLIRRADSSADNNSMKNHLQEAKWFIKSLRSRSETLLKVSTSIVERQQGFLDFGEEAMRPMVLHDIAEAVEMHESTISRVTTQKYMHTPRGIFELKYFFSSHVLTNTGLECSSTAIRALLKKLISAENTNKPLSDSKLATILSEQGINVARRTVAKYREGMAIPPSPERKSLM